MKMWVELKEDPAGFGTLYLELLKRAFVSPVLTHAPHWCIFGSLLESVPQQPLQAWLTIQLKAFTLLQDMAFAIWFLAFPNHNFL